jgi:aminopeptidase N
MENVTEYISLDLISPISYDITINLSSLKENNPNKVLGIVIYEFEVLKSTKIIELNVRDIIIKKTELIGFDFKVDFEYNDKEAVIFTFPSELPEGKLKLKIEFEGKFSDTLMGQYVTNYRDSNGDAKKLVVIQHESCFARQVCRFIVF